MGCINHPSEPAVAVCSDCGAEVCAGCLRTVQERAYCPADYGIARYGDHAQDVPIPPYDAARGAYSNPASSSDILKAYPRPALDANIKSTAPSSTPTRSTGRFIRGVALLIVVLVSFTLVSIYLIASMASVFPNQPPVPLGPPPTPSLDNHQFSAFTQPSHRLTITTGKGVIVVNLYQDAAPDAVFTFGLNYQRFRGTHFSTSANVVGAESTSYLLYDFAPYTPNNLPPERGAFTFSSSDRARVDGFDILRQRLSYLDRDLLVVGQVASGLNVLDQLEDSDIVTAINLEWLRAPAVQEAPHLEATRLVTITTSSGVLVAELYGKAAPKSANEFVYDTFAICGTQFSVNDQFATFDMLGGDYFPDHPPTGPYQRGSLLGHFNVYGGDYPKDLGYLVAVGIARRDVDNSVPYFWVIGRIVKGEDVLDKITDEAVIERIEVSPDPTEPTSAPVTTCPVKK